MIIFRHLFLLFVILNNAHAGLQQNYYRTFWSPEFHGHRLDYCMAQGKQCGLPVANRYCQLMGYERSNQHVMDYNVGMTQDFVNRKPCKGWQCNGFMKIRCVNKLTHHPVSAYYYRAQEFVFPRFNHDRVDWCYEHGKGCGLRAAQSFCRRMGYARAKHYEMQDHVSQTRAIGNHEVCVGEDCNAFSRIVCYR